MIQQLDSELVKVFVYGTLKPGESNYQYYCGGKVVAATRATVKGQLFALPLGYPAMVLGKGVVQGYLLTFNTPNILQHLDLLEGYNPQRPPEENFYDRKQLEVYSPEAEPLGLAWAYFMTLEQVEQIGGVLIPSGWWTGH
ncbi:gamma-glutamylcyclotransferase [Aerosakkonemataceae cyanobacterium BLCC-F50]|uniref:Gamma-glutamylcyclotransferase n=1 Tax=Floridaenema flaviceps BLCC-F50 TaxID=3153642 RepID=A0ABV4XM41_9CYAN